jgi:hypothetical protein
MNGISILEKYGRLVEKIDKKRDGRSILYLPMRRGAEKIGEPLETEFDRKEITYEKCPVFYDSTQKRITAPTFQSYQEKETMLMERTERGVLKVVWDDVISEGIGTLSFYDWLLKRQALEEDILITAYMDSLGITQGLCIEPMYSKERNPKQTRDSLIRQGKIISQDIGPEDFNNNADILERFYRIFERRKPRKGATISKEALERLRRLMI